ncbi:MAG: extracellular solute-binding protein [Proteobacteria bacterium]|nr:extracellular solute-binding protein [Pseudomonadota bacterium]MBI3496270.1 extracellular solute-binding protein [Pseudomonadota bacterium]
MQQRSKGVSKKYGRRAFLAVAASGAVALGLRPARAESVQIDYWQYFFKERVEAMDELIRRFQAENPGIIVKQTTFPYAQYRTKVAAAVPAGVGPDLMQLYYGWLREYRKAGLLQELPRDLFPPDRLDRSFFPMVQQMRLEGAYYAVPTAVRSLALFTNRRLMQEAGLAAPPLTLDSFVEQAARMTKRDGGGNLTIAGTTIGLPSQDSHWWREVLVRQFGGTPFSPDYRKVTYGDEHGAAALKWYSDLERTHRVAQAGFMSETAAAFRAGRAGLHVDGSFLIGSLQQTRNLDWAAAELPTHNGIQANYSSYWVNALTASAGGVRREAALKFLAFITADEAMTLWLEKTGELPAKPSVALAPASLANPAHAAIAKGLAYAVATDFVDEDAQREVFVQMLDRVLLQGQDPLTSVREAASAEQRIIDAYYAKG